MREHELHDLLGGLADRLDEASPPLDVELVLRSPRAGGSQGRRPLYLLSAAAALVVVAAIVWSRQAPGDDGRTKVLSESQPRIDVVGAAGPIADGQVVQVAGSGFDPDSEITLQQCGTDGCDAWRPPIRTSTDQDGQFVVDVVVYVDIATGRGSTPGSPVEPGWSACTRCELKVEGGSATARAALAFAATVPPQHPTVRIATSPPYAPGQAVRLEGSGFRPDPDGLEVGVAYCAADAQRSEECGGGPDLGDFGVAPDGSFVVESFTLPSADVVLGGTRCVDRPGACVVTWFLSAPGPLPAGVPLDLSGGEGQ